LTLEVDLDRRFEIVTQTLEVAGDSIELWKPRSAEALINEQDFEADERLPYWAEVWPSSIALAACLPFASPGADRAIELGCGVGFITAIASRRSWRVLATDYYSDALAFTRLNALRNGLREPATRHVDWRVFPEDLRGFDLVLASDVLYERPYAELVAAALQKTISASGRALVADPGRVAAEEFVRACGKRDLKARVASRVPYKDGSVRQTISIYEITR
jgi:ETFB lysine methyltransferase